MRQLAFPVIPAVVEARLVAACSGPRGGKDDQQFFLTYAQGKGATHLVHQH